MSFIRRVSRKCTPASPSRTLHAWDAKDILVTLANCSSCSLLRRVILISDHFRNGATPSEPRFRLFLRTSNELHSATTERLLTTWVLERRSGTTSWNVRYVSRANQRIGATSSPTTRTTTPGPAARPPSATAYSLSKVGNRVSTLEQRTQSTATTIPPPTHLTFVYPYARTIWA